jgi:glycosyltransferase involved in cell wall biosynthesis
MYRSNVPGTIAGRLAGVPVILGHVHSVATWETRQRIMDRLTARLRTATVCVSQRVQSDLCATLNLPPERCPVIHNGLNLALFEAPMDRARVRAALGLGPEEVALICVARLHPQKNHAGLLEAVASLPQDLPPWRLILAGDGSERASLQERSEALGLAARVTFLGSRDDVPQLLRACDLCVLASDKEGFCMAVVESLAAGLPTVATDAGGVIAEAITEGQSGHLVRRGDMAALAERLARLIGDPAARARMGAPARESARRFDLGVMVLQMELLYLQSLKRARPDLLTGLPSGVVHEREARLRELTGQT